MDNADVAKVLSEIADLLEVHGENVFRVRAYRNASRIVESLGEAVTAVLARGGPGALAELPGIGDDLAHKIDEIARTGTHSIVAELTRDVPESIVEMMRVVGVGPKRAKLLFEKLRIRSIDDLVRACERGELRGIRGFGETLEAKIRKGCAEARERASRRPLAEADAHADAIVRWMRGGKGAVAIEICGSLRRRRETIGDVDLLVATSHPGEVSDRFLAYPEVREITARGEGRCAVVLRSGMQVDLRMVEPAQLGAALHYFTGSKPHNVAIRTLGVKRGLKINEYGVFRGERRIGGAREEDVFRAVGLPFIPPELREDRGEIEAAREGTLPDLVELRDVRGDLHVHTDATDGTASIAEMVAACLRKGWSYCAITDHSRAVRVTGGLDRAGFRAQAREVAKVRAAFPDIHVFHGGEIDVLEDGRLDLDDRTLDELDLVVAAVHAKLDLPERAMTDRILRAMKDPRVTVLAHPTGRLLGRREPYAVDIAQIARAAAHLGVLLEIDAQPERLDLSDTWARVAKDAGALLVVDTDAHRVAELDFMRYGVEQARRGWCTARDVANTRPLAALRKIVARRRAHTTAA